MNEIKNDPYFRTNHAKQLQEGISIYLKYIALGGYEVDLLPNGLPYFFTPRHFYYEDAAVRDFLSGWLKMDPVDRTFYIIDMEKQYEEEKHMKMLMKNYEVEELLE